MDFTQAEINQAVVAEIRKALDERRLLITRVEKHLGLRSGPTVEDETREEQKARLHAARKGEVPPGIISGDPVLHDDEDEDDSKRKRKAGPSDLPMRPTGGTLDGLPLYTRRRKNSGRLDGQRI